MLPSALRYLGTRPGQASSAIIHPDVCYSPEQHFQVGFCPKKPLEQPKTQETDTTPQKYLTIPQSSVQVQGNGKLKYVINYLTLRKSNGIDLADPAKDPSAWTGPEATC